MSSTFDDLVDHRKAVDEIIGRLSAQFRGMELFGSRPFEPKKVCFDEIASSEIFVGIYAHRYGWIPDGDFLSITEQEFDEARRLSRPCFCYVVDPDHPWNPKHIEFPALEKVKRFHTKIGTLVRSRFTTPDNLAKQVAADLVAAFSSQHPARTTTELLDQLRTNILHEISTTIGSKYIRDLYVNRALDRNLRLRLQQPARTAVALQTLQDAMMSILATLEGLSKLKPLTRDVISGHESVTEAQATLATLAKLPPHDPALNYPAQTLTGALLTIRGFVTAAERLHASEVRHGDHDVVQLRILATHLAAASTAIADATNTVKPVHLIVDRAGGGKTNLLCHLAETFTQSHPTFFFAARSVPDPTADSIKRYLTSAYPLSDEPIELALHTSAKDDRHCIIIIDGINEHPDPRGFNAALKDFIRSHYHKPVKFLISCRDIYWRYFEDEWWLSHGASVSRDALYSFTRVEYRKALSLYLQAFDIEMQATGTARTELQHPLLLRFFCEAYRGSPTSPTRIGQISELRLLELFDAYCQRKFEHIRSRLGLIDAEEIVEYLKMIALEMIEHRSRALPVSAVAQKARNDFGERSLRTIDSRYFHILDEDILIEERPLQSLSDTVVTFVYDEFMEYMIARALWSRSVRSEADAIIAITDETSRLLQARSSFISVDGVVLYFGDMVARLSEDHLLKYMDELSRLGAVDLACSIAVRISRTRPRQAVFQQVLAFHRDGTRTQRHHALGAIEKMAPAHWTGVLSYFSIAARPGLRIRGQHAFSLLRRASEDLPADDQYAAVQLIQHVFDSDATAIGLTTGIDVLTGINAVAQILRRCENQWPAERCAFVRHWQGGVSRRVRDRQRQ